MAQKRKKLSICAIFAGGLLFNNGNTTVLLEFQHAGRPVGLLVDPMLAPRGSLPALRYLGTRRQRNPLVDLPAEVAQAAALTTGAVVVNHLEALDHCPTTRAQVRALAQRGGWAHRLWVPEDGECRYYPVPTVKSHAMKSVAAEA